MEVFTLTERKTSNIKLAIMWLSLVVAIAFFLIACVNKYFLAGTVIFAAIWAWLYMNRGVEYECSYFDGDFRFAKILNKSRRKKLAAYTIEDVIQIAPAGDSSVTFYENNKETLVKDFTSGVQGVPYYDIVVKDSKTNKALLIKAELDDEYLNAVSIKYRSKVVRKQW